MYLGILGTCQLLWVPGCMFPFLTTKESSFFGTRLLEYCFVWDIVCQQVLPPHLPCLSFDESLGMAGCTSKCRGHLQDMFPVFLMLSIQCYYGMRHTTLYYCIISAVPVTSLFTSSLYTVCKVPHQAARIWIRSGSLLAVAGAGCDEINQHKQGAKAACYSSKVSCATGFLFIRQFVHGALYRLISMRKKCFLYHTLACVVYFMHLHTGTDQRDCASIWNFVPFAHHVAPHRMLCFGSRGVHHEAVGWNVFFP